MRKTLPADIYTKSEAIKLMRQIEQANKDQQLCPIQGIKNPCAIYSPATN